VIEIGYEGNPLELLELTQAIERKLGRIVSSERNAPRVVDVDLLYFGQESIVTESLILPHPRIQERRFVLQPLAEIRPDLILPGLSQTVSELLAALK
jgi:2-amino-4-hydroxy-6-hydroxymethyldihydropteridine diphosphokinase